MTSILSSSTVALQASDEDRAVARARAYAELRKMSEAMVEEKGLLNYAQAALLLDVSTKRISELVRLGKLGRFYFLGRPYVSVREIGERYQQELKAGRPPRSFPKRAAASVKAALKTDSAQRKLGGYAGPYVREQDRKKGQKNREQLKKVWRTIIEGPKK